MLQLIKTNKGRGTLSIACVIAFLVIAYINEPYTIDIFFHAKPWILLSVIFAGSFFLQFMISLALSEQHEGWKRLSLLLGGVGGISGGFLGYTGKEFRFNDFLEVTACAAGGLVIGLCIIVIGRWVFSGFSNQKKT